MRIANRAGSMLAAAALVAGAALFTGASPASATTVDDFTFKVQRDPNKSFGVVVYNKGHYAGMAYWQANPLEPDIPGDALQAIDSYADGWGVEAILIPDRTVSTAGHSAPYISPYKTGNLTEGSTVKLRACAVKDLNASCSDYYSGQA
ncbi:hypothetical protein [Streptomyces sp. NPDC001135]